MDFQILLKFVIVQRICSILCIKYGLQAASTRPGRIRRDNQYCTYTHVGKCERVVYDPLQCSLSGFRDCFRTEISDCDVNYVDCCEGYIMDQDVCYPKDEICEECYTLTDCDGKITKLINRQGTIRSKNYPEVYENNVDCSWKIRGGRNSTVSISILDLRLQKRRSECHWDWDLSKIFCTKTCLDWVVLEGGSVNENKRSTQQCGSEKTVDTFTTLASVAHVHFYSDSTISHAGFHISFTISGGEDPPASTVTTTTPQPSPSSEATHEPSTATKGRADFSTTTNVIATDDSDIHVCPGKLVWNVCPKCTRTCNNALQSEKECLSGFGHQNGDVEIECEPGCVCPERFPIWHDLKCVTYDACSADAKFHVVDHCAELGFVKGDCLRTCDNMDISTERCLAETLVGHTGHRTGGVFACACKSGTFLHEGKCINSRACQRELNKRCSGGMIWKSCSSKCQKTCAHTTCKKSGKATCEGACRCPDDRPIYHNNRCVTRRSCPKDDKIVCGKQFYKPVLKIIGGEKATKGSWPWLVQIEKKVDGEFTLSCGGTLICKKWVLTASHCFLNAGKTWLEKDTWKYRIHIGKHYKKYNTTDVLTGMLANITPSRIITHEGYHLTTHINDLALVELSEPIRMNRFIRPACIHNVSDYHPLAALGETCMAAGWGAETNSEAPESDTENPTMKQVELAARTHSLCTALFFNFNIETMHCVGGHQEQDTCAGDSGGPLMCIRNNRWFVDGVVSYGLKCGVLDQPGVYTRVPHYAGWIRRHTGPTCGEPTAVWNS